MLEPILSILNRLGQRFRLVEKRFQAFFAENTVGGETLLMKRTIGSKALLSFN
jgi:hypothetical protein